MQAKTILLTGASGSIGSELHRQLVKLPLEGLVLVDRQPIVSLRPAVELRIETDLAWPGALDTQLSDVDLVIHAAASKHVPELERDPIEALENNVMVTRNLARACHRRGVPQFLMVSTDKALDPVSVMGQSKRIAESYVLRLGYSVVRLVNVYGSSGSVVEIFRNQLARGEPLTITDPDMTRYFIQPDEVGKMILNAARLAHGGDLFLSDPGEPIRIGDLAREMSGHGEVRLLGARPGERKHEPPMLPNPDAEATEHPGLYRIQCCNNPSLELAEEFLRPAFGAHERARAVLTELSKDSGLPKRP